MRFFARPPTSKESATLEGIVPLRGQRYRVVVTIAHVDETQPERGPSASTAAIKTVAEANALITGAAKDLADYQRLTAEGKLGEPDGSLNS